MKKCKICSFFWCFWACYKCSICFSCWNIFVQIDYYYLLYFIIRICRTVFIIIFFLITVKIFIFCEIIFSFIQSDRNVLYLCNINIHEIMYKDRWVQEYWDDKLKNSLSVWLFVLWNLIEMKIFINLLIENDKFCKNWWYVSAH